jgi:hypothetical protein
MKTFLVVLALLLPGLNWGSYLKTENQTKPKVQIALLLDTSNSMDGLIAQAKTQLWKIVNEMATARYNGQAPDLEIALYEYGNDGLQAAEGFIRLVAPLTTDLDLISQELFALKTYGGEEYCGQVIGKSVQQLTWSKSTTDLKMIFIAGNEPFTQGNIDYKTTCKNAATKGIVVNTIFCGSNAEGVNTFWKDGAERADGKYINIDQDQTVAEIETPFDDSIIKLNSRLNSTYIGYGKKAEEMEMRQVAQDANAASYSKSVSVNRAVTKSTSNYQNSNWDLVDAAKDKSVKLEELKKEDLPEEMQKMTKEEQKIYLDKKLKERETIQKQIKETNAKREKYISEQQKQNPQESTLDAAMIKIVRDQAQKKNYTFTK